MRGEDLASQSQKMIDLEMSVLSMPEMLFYEKTKNKNFTLLPAAVTNLTSVGQHGLQRLHKGPKMVHYTQIISLGNKIIQ